MIWQTFGISLFKSDSNNFKLLKHSYSRNTYLQAAWVKVKVKKMKTCIPLSFSSAFCKV